MEKKIVSTFMFSEPHEQELLWLKFNVEDAFVSEWIITESTFTFQGKSKEKYFEKILEQSRFERFRYKIHYIKLDRNFNFEFEPKLKEVLKRKIKRWLMSNSDKEYELVSYAELASFYAEIKQRGACLSHIKSKYSKNDVVLTCDTDEIFDFNGDKNVEFLTILNKNETPFYIKREIFCYDYDNCTNRIRYSPIVSVKDILLTDALHAVRHPLPANRNVIKTKNPLVFEFTFCFSKAAIVKKLYAFAHVTDLNEKALDFCFTNNISLISPDQISEEYKHTAENFYSKIELATSQFPEFLIRHFEDFSTGIVNPNHIEARKNNKLHYVHN